MASAISVQLDSRTYTWDGRHWFGADDYTVPPQQVIHRLDLLLPPERRLAVKQQLKASRELEDRHFVAYHNPQRMGYTAAESDPFSVYTSKHFLDPIGDTVWMITGEGKSPKQYYLSSWFVVSEVGPSDDTDFGYSLSGQGGVLDPMPRLNDLDWFPAFIRRMANFSFGVQEIKQAEVVEALKQLAAEAQCPPA
jgi:hypothetical protein